MLDDGFVDVAVDGSGLSFVDSAGLRTLVLARRDTAARGGSLWLRTPSPALERLLELSGLTDLFVDPADRRPSDHERD